MVCFKSDRILIIDFFCLVFSYIFFIFIILTIYIQKGTQGNFWRWCICLLPWLWWWFLKCLCMSNPLKLYMLNMCSFLYQLYYNKTNFPSFLSLSLSLSFFLSFFFLSFFLRAAPVAYGSSQPRGQIRAVGFQQLQILNPLSETRDWTLILMDTMSGS